MIDLEELELLAHKPDCTTDELIQLADAVGPLVERVRELERMVKMLGEDIVAGNLGEYPRVCLFCSLNDHLGKYCDESCLLQKYAEAAKEAGECVRDS